MSLILRCQRMFHQLGRPTPPQRTVNVASCCIITVVPVGGTCVDNVVSRTWSWGRLYPTPPHPTTTYCQRSITLHHHGRPSWWNMRWKRSIKDVVVKTLISHPTPPHPTPPHIYIYIQNAKMCQNAEATRHGVSNYSSNLYLAWIIYVNSVEGIGLTWFNDQRWWLKLQQEWGFRQPT